LGQEERLPNISHLGGNIVTTPRRKIIVVINYYGYVSDKFNVNKDNKK